MATITNNYSALETLTSQTLKTTPSYSVYKEHLDFATFLSHSANADLESTQQSIEHLMKPNAGYFSEITGATRDEANEILYGVIGSNKDLRDWSKIMTSDEPLLEARKQTAQMYNSDLPYASADATYLDTSSTLVNSYNLAITQQAFEDGSTKDSAYFVSSTNMVLRGVDLNSKDILTNGWYFGFDVDKNPYVEALAAQEKADEAATNTTTSTEELLASKPTNTTPTTPTTTTTTPTTEVTTTSPITDSNLVALTNLYQSYLNREPDTEGLAYWTEKLNSGATLQEIENAFYLSEEFVSLSQGTTTPTTPTTTTPSSTASSIATALENATLEDLLKLV